MAEKINIEGVKGTWYWDELSAEMENKIDRVFERFADDVAAEARGIANLHDNTGTLKNGIGHARSKFQKLMGWLIISRAPHSHLVEYGTKERTRGSGGSTGRMPKIGLLWPGYDKHKRGVRQRLKGIMD